MSFFQEVYMKIEVCVYDTPAVNPCDYRIISKDGVCGIHINLEEARTIEEKLNSEVEFRKGIRDSLERYGSIMNLSMDDVACYEYLNKIVGDVFSKVSTVWLIFTRNRYDEVMAREPALQEKEVKRTYLSGPINKFCDENMTVENTGIARGK
jgi:hypothetical protein